MQTTQLFAPEEMDFLLDKSNKGYQRSLDVLETIK